MNGVPIRLTKDVHGVGVRGLATRVDADLAKVLIGQNRAEVRELPEKEAPAEPKPKAALAPAAEPLQPEAPIDVPLTKNELKKKLDENGLEYPPGATRVVLVNLYLEYGLHNLE